MTVRPGGHEFVPGGEAQVSHGRRYVLCAECGKARRGAAHQPVDPRSRRMLATAGTVARLVPVMAAPPVVREPREVTMLRLAIDAVLDRSDIGYTARLRLVAARQALDLPNDAAPAPLAAVGAPASPTTRPSRKSDLRWVRRSIPGLYRTIAEAAIDQGFRPERSGNGHVRFTDGMRAFSLSTTVGEGRGHNFENARAAARRAGVQC